jgi:hypothetical protein
MFIVFLLYFIQGVLQFNLVFLGVYKVQDQTKAQFVANAIQVDMQRRHFYTAHHAAKVANAAAAYRAKHGIVDTNMG